MSCAGFGLSDAFTSSRKRARSSGFTSHSTRLRSSMPRFTSASNGCVATFSPSASFTAARRRASPAGSTSRDSGRFHEYPPPTVNSVTLRSIQSASVVRSSLESFTPPCPRFTFFQSGLAAAK